jgi:hypothetical protein
MRPEEEEMDRSINFVWIKKLRSLRGSAIGRRQTHASSIYQRRHAAQVDGRHCNLPQKSGTVGAAVQHPYVAEKPTVRSCRVQTQN